VVSNARPKYSKRYMLIVGAGTCAVAVMALAAVAAHGRSSELMQGSDEVSLTLRKQAAVRGVGAGQKSGSAAETRSQGGRLSRS
jgi:hypothetical protein